MEELEDLTAGSGALALAQELGREHPNPMLLELCAVRKRRVHLGSGMLSGVRLFFMQLWLCGLLKAPRGGPLSPGRAHLHPGVARTGVNFWRLLQSTAKQRGRGTPTDSGQQIGIMEGVWKEKKKKKENTLVWQIIVFLPLWCLLVYNRMRSVLKSLCRGGVLFLYRKAPWRESSLASQGLSPRCVCPSAQGRSESPLRRQPRW